MTDFSKIIQWNLQHEGRAEEMRKKVGNAFWNYQHTLAEWIPPDDAKQKLAFENLKLGVKTFPCESCSKKGMEYIYAHPFNNDLKTYVWQFHNAVNHKLNKPEYPLPKEYGKVENCVPKHILKEFASSINDKNMSKMIEGMVSCET
jgi:hypothetical protein